MTLAALVLVLVVSGDPIVIHKGDPGASFTDCRRLGTVRSAYADSWLETERELAKATRKKGGNFVHVRKRLITSTYHATGQAYACPTEALLDIIAEGQESRGR